MKITVANGAGFCFGVRRAYKILEAEIEASKQSGARVFTLGSFVHNPLIIEELRSRGVPPITEAELPAIAESASADSPVTVVLRTHGVSKELAAYTAEMSVKNPHFKTVDCTCPCVSHIHRIVEKESEENTEDKLIVIIGDPEHPEVKAIRSYSECECLVFPTLEALKTLKTDKKQVVCVAQTTQKITECKLCQNYLLNLFTSCNIYDTICKVTEERQTEVQKLAGKSDVMLIIGGRESSNTNKLYEISKRIQPKTFFVEQISELPLECIDPNTNLGISAGASTPDSLIEEAIKAMSDIEKNTEDFATLFNESEMNLPRTGSLVKGVVAGINDREITVDLAANLTGIISSNDISDDEEVVNNLKIGDEIEAIVVKKDDSQGIVFLSKKQAETRVNKGKIETAFKNGDIIEGKIVEVATNKDGVAKGLVISALSTKLFIPASQTGVAKDGDISALLGTVQSVKITELGTGRRAVASISVVAREKRNAEIEEFWSTLEVGQVFEGTVKSMTDYGVFVNIGPVDGMVHKSELSWKRFRIPSDIVSVGDKLTVYIKDLNVDKRRISLGCKTAENNPWNVFMSKYSKGDVASVKIASIMTYGAFAEIVDGVDGLIHISQIA
ncbi:MAG: 4-hydroxy-3-methylbut-2-enyl diphosphate reductase, partial [Clostridia bacterium]|nr:4-hydroxy-3-methylbut-2-enyl diphosphate reductase [Clostridia bacterium]